MPSALPLQNNTIENHDFANAVLDGLKKRQKRIPSSYLYDKRGSELFEDITRLKEYYPTRTEISILERYTDEFIKLSGSNISLVEFGSGSSRKTKILIRAFHHLESYIPIDISKDALDEAKENLISEFPNLNIVPVHADFDNLKELPQKRDDNFLLGFFPGSTLGNFEYKAAIGFLKNARTILGLNSALLIGIDLQKGPEVLIPAYDDAEGVTASFNLNLLHRMNSELDADFNIEAYEHKAVYNDHMKRVEMHIKSLTDQSVNILGNEFNFNKNETIHTENSHKYSIQDFHALAESAGWKALKYWTDDNELFSLHYLSPML